MTDKDEPTQRRELDLNAVPPGWNLTIAPDENPADGKLRRFKDYVLFIAALIAVGVFLWICVGTVLDPNSSPDDKKWATALITGMSTALLGFLVGKKS